MKNYPKLKDCNFELNERIGVLTLQRDDIRNVLTGSHIVDDIVQTVDWIKDNDSIAALILTGEGKAFSAGGNVKEMSDKAGMFSGDAQQIRDNYLATIQRMPLAIQSINIPVIAAVNGPAIGAGFDLACMCDFRLASTKAWFAESFINLGLIPGDGGGWFLQRLIGYQHAAELTMSGRRLDVDEALHIGLLLKVCEPEELMLDCIALAASMVEKPKQALCETKRILKLAQHGTLEDFLAHCAEVQGHLHQEAEHHAATAAFLKQQAANKM